MFMKLALILGVIVAVALSDASPDPAPIAAVSPVKPVAAKGSYSAPYAHQISYDNSYDKASSYDKHAYGKHEKHAKYDRYDDSDEYGHHHHGPNYGGQNHRHHDYFSFDTHYCSVHASFALVLPRENNQSPAYGSDNTYGGSSYSHDSSRRFFARQFCRYAATNSNDACAFCCRVAARSSNTSPDDIVAAIFAFDPANPTSNGAGYYGGNHDAYDGGYRKKRDVSAGVPIKQCVCCAPKREY